MNKVNKIDELSNYVSSKNMLQSKFIENSLNELTSYERKQFECLISFYCSLGYSIEFQAASYLLFVSDTLEEQIYFVKEKKYRYSTFNEVKSAVYDNAEYMTKAMIGLALSTYIWKNHLYIKRWFDEKIKTFSGKYLLEIGPGHGENFLSALKINNFKEYHAIDVSHTSVELTRKFLEYSLGGGLNEINVTIEEKDFLAFNTPIKYDTLIMGEVLEHVENPKSFLEKIDQIINQDAYVYITTVINGPTKDHIYLFKTEEEVFDLVSEAGFRVVDYICTTGNNIDIEKAKKKKTCINIALILQREVQGCNDEKYIYH